MRTKPQERCIHCLALNRGLRNRKLGQLEKDLLIRLVLSTDPKGDATSGLAAKVFRSLGLDAEGLPEKEKTIRAKLEAELRAEFIPSVEVNELPGKISVELRDITKTLADVIIAAKQPSPPPNPPAPPRRY